MKKRFFLIVMVCSLLVVFCQVSAQNGESVRQQYSEHYAKAYQQVQMEILNNPELRSDRNAASEYLRNRMEELSRELLIQAFRQENSADVQKLGKGNLKSNSITQTVDPDDRLALEALYNQCNGPNWTKQANWMTTEPVETWEGVTVEYGRVVGLNLSDWGTSVGLSGILPAELANLTGIKSISLGNNALTGALPDNWSSFNNIEFLDLTYNQFTGNLPATWSTLANLQWLYLTGNQLSGTLPDSWSSMLNLRGLSIFNNNLSGSLPASWSNLQNMMDLSLFSNQFTGTLPESWSSLVNLQWLSLNENQLSGSLPESWSALINLHGLYLQGNELTGTLPQSWSTLVNLESLFLAQNKLTGTLPASWSSFVNLRYLYLSSNLFEGSLPSEWATFGNLTDMSLLDNQLSGNLPENWSALTNLVWLSLQGNQLTGSVPPSWSSMVNLQALYLHSNQLSGSVPESLSSLLNLERLGLSDNNLSGELPASWSIIIKLQDLYLSNNHFTGVVPESWASLTNLWALNLENNQITGLPNLSAIPNLAYLTVQNNVLDFGDIEPNIGVPKYQFLYNPQAPVGLQATVSKNAGMEFKVSVTVSGNNNRYQWYKNGSPISGASGAEYLMPSVTGDDAGVYNCRITNTVATDLTLFSQPVTLLITNSNTDLTAFNFTYTGCGCNLGTRIDPLVRRILVKVPKTVNITNLAPSNIVIPPGATILPSPSLAQNWTSGPVNYTVTASDGVTQTTWSVKVENPPCAEVNLIHFDFDNDVEATMPEINSNTATVTVSLKPGVDLSSLNPIYALPCGATITTLSGDPFPGVLDFSVINPQQFKVVAQNETDFKIWSVQVNYADVIPPGVTTWSTTVDNCEGSVEVQTTEPGRVFIINEKAINMTSLPFPTSIYNLADWTSGSALSVYSLVVNHLGAWTTVFTANSPIEVNTSGLYAGTYWAFSVDNSGNVSQISSESMTLTQCEVEVSGLCNLRTMNPVWKYRLTSEIFISYEENRTDGNIKYAQDGTCGIFIKDINSVLDAVYGEGAGLTNLFGTLDFSGTDLTFIPCCSSPVISSTGNTIAPINVTYDQFKTDCYLNTSPKKYESMLVKITTPMIALDDYDAIHPNWMFNTIHWSDLATKNAIGALDYFIQSIFNSTLIGTPIPTTPQIYQGIRTNVNWGSPGSPMIYGLFTPRNALDITPVTSPALTASPNPIIIAYAAPGQCKSIIVKIANSGVGDRIIESVQLDSSPTSSEFSMGTLPSMPFTLGTWGTVNITLNFCPVSAGPKSTNLIFEYESGMTFVVPVTGMVIPINTTPSCEDFNAAGWNDQITNGWTSNGTGGLGNTIGFVKGGYYSARMRTGNSGYHLVIYPYNLKTVYGITPGYVITSNTLWLTFLTGKRDYFINGIGGTAPSVDPRKVLISTDNQVTWKEIWRTTFNQIPDVFAGGLDPKEVEIPLAAYEGKTAFFKFEAYRNGANRGEWFVEDMCIKDKLAGPAIGYDGDGDFGKLLAADTKQKSITIRNIGLSLLHVRSVEIVGDPEFSVNNPGELPIDISGDGYAWSEYPIVPLLDLTVQFTPSASQNYSAVLRIKYGLTEEILLDIPLTGKGISCADAIPISPPVSTVNIVSTQDELFKYTALYDQIMTVTSCHENNTIHPTYQYSYDTFLMMYSGCPLIPANLIGSNDDMQTACVYNRASSSMTVTLSAGQTVYIWWPLVFPTALNAFDPFVFTLSVSPSPPWPDAEFEASQTLIEAGSSIDFRSLSTGDPSSWEWNFTAAANPSSSTAQNPAGINYPVAGIYQVIHKATNAFYTGTRTKDFYIVVGEPESVPAMTESFSLSLLKIGGSIKGGGWTFVDNNNSGMNWQVRNTGVGGCSTNEWPMQSKTGYSGYLVLPADEYNCVGGITSFKLVDAYAQSPSFDCSAFDAVVVEFQQRFRVCCNPPKMDLMVSIDGGLNWKSYDLLNGRMMNETVGNPVENVKLNITEIAAKQPDVRIRFYWQGSSEYFWMIDDVEVMGINACEGFKVSIAGDDLVYLGYNPKSSTTLIPSVVGGQGPYAYHWSTGEITPTIEVRPIETTEYILDVIDIQGCSTRTTFTVEVLDVRCGDKLDKVLMCKPGNEKKKQPQSICIEPISVPDLLKTGATLGACKQSGPGGDGTILEFDNPEMNIYPNPTNGQVNIELKGLIEGQIRIEVQDVLGRMVYREETIKTDGQYLKSIDIQRSGVYFITVKSSSVTLSKQVSVIR